MASESKLGELEKLYNKAAKAELGSDFGRAFKLYIQTAEGYLHLSRIANNAAVTSICKGQAAKALERAERIKKAKGDIALVIRDHFSEQEQTAVLHKSSQVNGLFVPLWNEPVKGSIALEQPPLSPEQIERGAVYRDITNTASSEATIDKLSPEDIIQHIISDCSVCASIAICIEHNRRFGSKLGVSSLEHDKPGPSTARRSRFKALFNGEYRRVRIEIDHQLPCYSDGRPMCLSTRIRDCHTPSLLEKAYMRLVGGYDFPGSNSSIDLHVMTGWIPEHIEVKSSQFEREKTWSRILQGHTRGHCVLTVGTGERLPNVHNFPIPLLPAHCYAVIDVKEDDSDRRMTIIDSRIDELDISKLSLEDDPDRPDSRSFDLSWDEVCAIFDGIYLSWDPKIFSHDLKFHGMWTNPKPGTNEQTRHFRLSLKAEIDPSDSNDHEVWVLLTRHVVDSKRKGEYISLSSQVKDVVDRNISQLKGAYTNSTHVLVKSRVSLDSPELSITASYDGNYDNVGFTITAYSNRPLSWVRETVYLPYTEKISSGFTARTAGGNPSYPTFMNNPQYHLRFHGRQASSSSSGSRRQKARIEVTVQGDRHVPLHVDVVYSQQGERVMELARNEIVASSGPYSYGVASITKEIPVGEYAVVVSAFEPQQLGQFTMNIASSERFDVTPIPQEGAGMFAKIVQGAWTADTAGGGPTFKKYTSNPLYELKVPSTSQCKIRLQLLDSSQSAPINVALFRLTEKGTLGPHVVTSGPYSDTVSGVVTPQVNLHPASYLIVPSTYTPGILANFRLVCYSSIGSVSVTPFTRRE
ncbi:cysteine proteinase [Panus rudis PR-1116 ss-1]|nr:cysteine proteinase [Panus rudis PR-1116 ss-1]